MIVVALLAIGLPIVLAINMARKQALETETNRAMAYARDVLHRSDQTVTQVSRGVEMLLAERSENPCSDEAVAIMRQIDLGSSYIQAIGLVVDDRFLCSSLGQDAEGLALGPVDFTTPQRASVRLNVEFPFAKGSTFLVVERDGYGAIIHKDLPIDTSTEEEDVSLATVQLDNDLILTSRGVVKPEWVKRLGDKKSVSFTEGGHLIAIIRSDTWQTAAIAAIPTTYLEDRVRSFAMLLIPIGLLGGVALAAALSFLVRLQAGLPAVIKGALRHNEFFLLYQPIVNVQTGAWVGAEALIRWKRPSGEMIRPDIFISAAEDAGLIEQITERVFELVAHDAGDIFRRYPHFHIAINLSSADLKSTQTIELLKQLAERTHAGPENLIIEATERGFMHADAAREIIGVIRKNGISVAIDDFGTGYSSLAYLETFELDYLKIDKSFVDTLGTESATSQVVPHIIELAKDLKLAMIAEGVEQESQAQFLRERGVQFAQGWLFGKPMAMSDLVGRLQDKVEPAVEAALSS